jgi:hypothetical protein
MTVSSTTSSSAEIIPFEASPPLKPNGQRSFAQARDAWLKLVLGDKRLTSGEARLCSVLSLHFSYSQYDKSAELIAWPAWETLMAESTLCRMTVYRSLENLEGLGVLEVTRGRYDRAAKRRAGNRYRALLPRYTGRYLGPQSPEQSSQPRYRSNVTRTLLDSSSLDSTRVRKKAAAEEASTPFGGFGPKEDFEPFNSGQPPSFGFPGSAWQPSTSPQATAASSAPPPGVPRGPPSPRADRWRRERAEDEATLERYSAAAANGCGR